MRCGRSFWTAALTSAEVAARGVAAARAGTLAGLLEWRAAEAPATVAILAPGKESLTYRELNALVRTQHDALRESGILPDDRVAVVLPDGYDTAACMLTIAASAVCVPINPVSSEADLCMLFRRLRARAVVTTSLDTRAGRAARQTGTGVFTLTPDKHPGSPISHVVPAAQGRANKVNADISGEEPDDTALLLITSGSTGQPKLVSLSHANVLAAASATSHAYQLSERDRRLNFMPLYHVQGFVGSLVASLVAGASIVCMQGFEPSRVPEWVSAWAATWYSATPTMHHEILRARSARLGGMHVDGLRFVRAGSAALPGKLRGLLEDALGVPVIESYGMTEAHQIASTPMEPERFRPGTVGPPTGSEIAILRAAGAGFADAGCLGEIVIRGPNVMRGYADDPSANRESFVDGWFRTGDIGMLDDEGYLIVHSRLKEIINRGGEKVSPREVDDVLLGHPAVAEAITFPVPDARLQEDVGAAIVLADGARLDAAELRRYAGTRLPPFKVPNHIAFVDSIPRTQGGKVRRAGLAEELAARRVVMTSARDERDVADPGVSAVEAAVASLWRQALHLPDVGLLDDFFYIGGDSLTGAHVLQMINEVFGVELSPFAMYDEASTVQGMARLIKKTREGEGTSK